MKIGQEVRYIYVLWPVLVSRGGLIGFPPKWRKHLFPKVLTLILSIPATAFCWCTHYQDVILFLPSMELERERLGRFGIHVGPLFQRQSRVVRNCWNVLAKKLVQKDAGVSRTISNPLSKLEHSDGVGRSYCRQFLCCNAMAQSCNICQV